MGAVSVARFRALLARERLLAIVRGRNPDATRETVLALAQAGVVLIEVSLSGSEPLRVIAEARAALGDGVLLGAGTLRTGDDAERALEAGAQFAVTPALTPGAARAQEVGLPTLTGAFTPSEIVTAFEAGATAVKLFPASLGGPAYVRALREPLPDIPLVAVGGVSATNARAYLDAGALAIAVGSGLTGDAADGGDLAALRERAGAMLATMAGQSS